MTEAVKLLVEQIDEGIEFVTEGVGDKKEHFIKGPFLLQEELNRNRRKYPRSQMAPAVESYLKEYVERNRGLGELNHPETPTVNLDRAMLLTTQLVEDGNYYMGCAKLLTNTPMGAIAKALLDEGVELGVSSRATAKIQKCKDYTLVTEGLRLHAIDMVADPSAHKAFVNMVVEDVDWVLDPAGKWQAVQAERVVEEIVATSKKSAAQLNVDATKLFEAFVAGLGNKFRDHPDNAHLTRIDRKMLNEMVEPEAREERRALLVRARKHMAGITEDRDAFNALVQLRLLNG
jgi:hypothetical protein